MAYRKDRGHKRGGRKRDLPAVSGGALALLRRLWAGDPLAVADCGTLCLVVSQSGEALEIPQEWLDELEDAGLIRHPEVGAPTALTFKGKAVLADHLARVRPGARAATGAGGRLVLRRATGRAG